MAAPTNAAAAAISGGEKYTRGSTNTCSPAAHDADDDDAEEEEEGEREAAAAAPAAAAADIGAGGA